MYRTSPVDIETELSLNRAKAEVQERLERIAEREDTRTMTHNAFKRIWKTIMNCAPPRFVYSINKSNSKYSKALSSAALFLLLLRQSQHQPGWPNPGATNPLDRLVNDYFIATLGWWRRTRGRNPSRFYANNISAGRETLNRKLFREWIERQEELWAPTPYWYQQDEEEINRRAMESLRDVHAAKQRFSSISRMADPIEAAAAVAYEEGFEGDPLKNQYGGDIFVDEVPLEHFIKGEDGCLIHPKISKKR